MNELNTVERVRVKSGLTKPQMLRLLKAKAGRVTLFTARDDQIDSVFISRAQDIDALYDEWERMVSEEIEKAEKNIGNILSLTQAARVLWISEFHLAQLRARGQADSVQIGRHYNYSTAALRKLLRDNSRVIKPGSKKTRGPLANAFEEWLKHRPVSNSAFALAS